jgi:hypothetical protein
MNAMEPTTAKRPTRDFPRTADGDYKYTTPDGQPLYFEPTTMPGLFGDYPQIPASVTRFFRKLFRRTDTPAAR